MIGFYIRNHLGKYLCPVTGFRGDFLGKADNFRLGAYSLCILLSQICLGGNSMYIFRSKMLISPLNLRQQVGLRSAIDACARRKSFVARVKKSITKIN